MSISLSVLVYIRRTIFSLIHSSSHFEFHHSLRYAALHHRLARLQRIRSTQHLSSQTGQPSSRIHRCLPLHPAHSSSSSSIHLLHRVWIVGQAGCSPSVWSSTSETDLALLWIRDWVLWLGAGLCRETAHLRSWRWSARATVERARLESSQRSRRLSETGARVQRTSSAISTDMWLRDRGKSFFFYTTVNLLLLLLCLG